MATTNNSINSQDPIQVALGGSGLATKTAHSIQVGAGTSPETQLAVGTTGQVLIGATGADPAWGSLGTNTGLTAHGVLLGEGNSAIVATAAGTNGQLLIGSTSADPAFASLTSSGSTLTYTTGANTLNIDVTAPLNVAHGGTGFITAAADGILYGNTTSALGVTSAGTNGQVLLGATSAAPAFATLTSSASSMTYTTGANTLNLDVANWVGVSSWTPVLNFGGSSTGITYSTQFGDYIRIGALVFFNATLALTSKGSQTGAATVTGLPTSGSSGPTFINIFVNTAVTFTGQLTAYVNGTTINLIAFDTSGVQHGVSNTNFANGSIFYLTGSFMVGG